MNSASTNFRFVVVVSKFHSAACQRVCSYNGLLSSALQEGDHIGLMRKASGALHFYINGIDQGETLHEEKGSLLLQSAPDRETKQIHLFFNRTFCLDPFFVLKLELRILALEQV